MRVFRRRALGDQPSRSSQPPPRRRCSSSSQTALDASKRVSGSRCLCGRAAGSVRSRTVTTEEFQRVPWIRVPPGFRPEISSGKSKLVWAPSGVMRRLMLPRFHRLAGKEIGLVIRVMVSNGLATRITAAQKG